MCDCISQTRRQVLKGLALGAVMPPYLAFADSDDVLVIGGEAKINGQQQRSTKAEVFTLNAGAKGSVIKSKDQIFYLDPETEANFYRNDDGLMSNVIITAGGMLSLFGKKSGRDVVVSTPNAVGAIRGTTTYFAWQKEERQTYVCCCYGGVDLKNTDGGAESLKTSYHTAVVMPIGGGVAPAPYSKPLNHFDDDIETLEAVAGRKPRWQLPDGKKLFFAPNAVPLG